MTDTEFNKRGNLRLTRRGLISTMILVLVTFNVVSTKKENDMQIYFIEVKLPELKPGEFILGIASQELETDTKHHVTHAFRIK